MMIEDAAVATVHRDLMEWIFIFCLLFMGGVLGWVLRCLDESDRWRDRHNKRR